MFSSIEFCCYEFRFIFCYIISFDISLIPYLIHFIISRFYPLLSLVILYFFTYFFDKKNCAHSFIQTIKWLFIIIHKKFLKNKKDWNWQKWLCITHITTILLIWTCDVMMMLQHITSQWWYEYASTKQTSFKLFNLIIA